MSVNLKAGKISSLSSVNLVDYPEVAAPLFQGMMVR